MIQLTDVEVFVEIAVAGSFTAAAERLRLPKSSVARRLSRLETDVGCRLVARTTRTVALTEDGRAFLPHARRLLDDREEAVNAVRGAGKGASGHLSVSATGVFTRTFIAPYLPEFRARHPGVTVGVQATAARVEIGNGAGQVDIAVRLRTEGLPNLGQRKLGQFDFALVAAPAYLATRGAITAPADLADHQMIELGPVTKDNRIDLHGPGGTHAVRYVPGVQIDDPDCVHRVTLAGGGVAALPIFLVAADLRAGALARVLPGWAPAPIPVSVLFRTDISPSLRVRCYLDFLVETFARVMASVADAAGAASTP